MKRLLTTHLRRNFLKHTGLALGLLLFPAVASTAAAAESGPLPPRWAPAGDKIKTLWAEQVSPENTLPEYPRPLVERADWKNLNGLWQYAIAPKDQPQPAKFDGEILVPFAVESSLSGVQKEVGAEKELWYKRTFTLPENWNGKDILLNFGAVDWQAEVLVNGLPVGSHKGGYTPFTFNITPYLVGKTTHELTVRVWDPTDRGFQPRGKQFSKPRSIWYTPVTGIWQTVWLEPVAPTHITSVRTIPDIDKSQLRINVAAVQTGADTNVSVKVLAKSGATLAEAHGKPGKELTVTLPNPVLWTPDVPHLYDLKIALATGGTIVDTVKSYAALRKISAKADADGVFRMQLNNKNLFHYGPLDQGWWPDGLYTAPTDEALVFDILKTKEWGFNMISKHVKVEPARWYYHCDRLGILVWQDMPSTGGTGGPGSGRWSGRHYNAGVDSTRSLESVANFYREWQEIMDMLISNPSVVVWVPFNEAWGQFDTDKVVERTKSYDSSRLVNPASGGNHRPCGDILDVHNYPGPSLLGLFDAKRVNVLGEYGGIGLSVEDHLWWNKRNWGYVQFTDTKKVTEEYVKFAAQVRDMVKKDKMSAAVYTQTTDVEGEVNGLMTYDRKVIKIDETAILKANQDAIHALGE